MIFPIIFFYCLLGNTFLYDLPMFEIANSYEYYSKSEAKIHTCIFNKYCLFQYPLTGKGNQPDVLKQKQK